ncbi:hypothetical protein HCH_03751 [Hahella chejuensis KCTC 2396]|uniref:Uncharacterized protein n=1 Tax=Hahella chejuensis (strain KCTC 2396) TaxID=349521 RepID=Q2SFU0_HAHCH|nr:hypothetical protein HCH_03751 [Hahella chejuensis KCTC 2396]
MIHGLRNKLAAQPNGNLLQRRCVLSLPVIRMESVYEGTDQGAVNYWDEKM